MGDMNINEKLDKIIEQQDEEEKEKVKEFKIPFFSRVGTRNAKKNFVTVITINENKTLAFSKKQICDGTIDIEGVPRISAVEDVLYYKRNPIIIIPSWSLKPFSVEDKYKQDVKEKTTTTGMKLLLTKMKLEIISGKKPMQKGLLIGLLIAACVGYYMLSGGSIM